MASSNVMRKGIFPAVGALTASFGWTTPSPSACEAQQQQQQQQQPASSTTRTNNNSFGMLPKEEGDFHKLFPKRQLWQPKVEYPLWDKNWDNRHPASTGDEEQDRQTMRSARKDGVTRHIILIRHGQYDETEKDDSKRLLTDLGRKQADLTGQRLREMMDGASKEFGPCKIKVVRVSDMARAKETANIIMKHLPGVTYADPDPLFNEGRPCHTIPGGRASSGTIQKTDEGHSRIEEAFQKLFYRAPPPPSKTEDVSKSEEIGESEELCKHEFEIVVCHANVIRYFTCRALQIPPEAWLRLCTFNCSLTYLSIRPTGTVSCRMLGDMGHIPYGMSSFSMHTGYNW